MITFYPKDLEMWGDQFDFNPPITLLPNQKTDHVVFYNRAELIEFLKQHGVVLDYPNTPLVVAMIDEAEGSKGNPWHGQLHWVFQSSVTLGWFRDNYK